MENRFSTPTLPHSAHPFHQRPHYKRLYWLCQLLRALGLVYATWVTVGTVRYWGKPDILLQNFGRYLKADLSQASYWQTALPLTVFLLSCAALWLCIFCMWRCIHFLLKEGLYTPQAAQQLFRVGVWGFISHTVEIIGVYLAHWSLTWHVTGIAFPLWLLGPKNLMYYLFCAVIMAFALVFISASEIAQENQGFI